MNIIDWIVLSGTLIFIVAFGIWKTRGSEDIDSFLLGDKSMKWWSIGLSIMATQASAITFLSTPGQAYEDGMRFIQFYLGLPIAMVLISITAVPIYAKLKVYTAYEYLECRFDRKTRTLTALLFLIQRGLSTGITIFAPSIILSTIFGWNLTLTNIFIGGVVIVYTVSGGTKAVSVTQTFQMAVMLGGMIIAGGMVVYLLPHDISFKETVLVAGKLGKLNLIDFKFDFNDRYNFWSGMTGGLFLALSYFGADQSQVGRYLSGKSMGESRLGLIFNGLLKIPMQFLILFIGALVFVFYQLHQPPVFFNKVQTDKLINSPYAHDFKNLENEHNLVFQEKQQHVKNLVQAIRSNDQDKVEVEKLSISVKENEAKGIKSKVVSLIKKSDPGANLKDTDYVFITFVINHLPHGLIGLLLAVIFSAAMSSTASALNSLASTTCVDIYKRSIKKEASARHYLQASRAFTVLWGLVAIFFAVVASLLENLIQAVNILGSIFYGTILGVFVAAFYFKFITYRSVFYAALLTQLIIFYCYFNTEIAYLWYNVIGCFLVIVIAALMEIYFVNRKNPSIE